MCPRIIYSDEEEASMYLPLPSPISQRLLKGSSLDQVSSCIYQHSCMWAKLLQSCLTLCDHMGCSPPGSSVPKILQARILEWVAVLSFKGSSQPWDQTHVSYFSCIGRWFSTTSTTWGSPSTRVVKKDKLSGAEKPL